MVDLCARLMRDAVVGKCNCVVSYIQVNMSLQPGANNALLCSTSAWPMLPQFPTAHFAPCPLTENAQCSLQCDFPKHALSSLAGSETHHQLDERLVKGADTTAFSTLSFCKCDRADKTFPTVYSFPEHNS